MIPEVVVLSFDPKTAREEIKTVFAYPMARTLWLAVKYQHIVSESFNRDCVRYAREIERLQKKGLLTADQLFRILFGIAVPPGHGIIGSREHSFAEELLPFVNGEKTIGFTISEEARTQK